MLCRRRLLGSGSGAADRLRFAADSSAHAGPETALREFAGGQVKKGVRTIGMGGDGATTGNYALVYKDAGGAIFDEGIVRFTDTGNLFTFSAVGFTTPTFWDDAAFYVIALGQHGTGVRVWDLTPPSACKPPSRGEPLRHVGLREVREADDEDAEHRLHGGVRALAGDAHARRRRAADSVHDVVPSLGRRSACTGIPTITGRSASA